MQDNGTTVDPTTGKIYRLTAKKARSAQFRALEAAVEAAKDAQASYMRENSLAHDVQNARTVVTNVQPDQNGQYPAANGEVLTRLNELIVATRATQQSVKDYKSAHPAEFQPQQAGVGRVPALNVPRRGRGGRQGGRGPLGRG